MRKTINEDGLVWCRPTVPVAPAGSLIESSTRSKTTQNGSVSISHESGTEPKGQSQLLESLLERALPSGIIFEYYLGRLTHLNISQIEVNLCYDRLIGIIDERHHLWICPWPEQNICNEAIKRRSHRCLVQQLVSDSKFRFSPRIEQAQPRLLLCLLRRGYQLQLLFADPSFVVPG